jgi:mxaJ protein
LGRLLRAGWPLVAASACCVRSAASAAGVLTVCADPNNLPFSNQAQAGFENKIAELVAKDLGDTVQYVWWAQRRGYMRNTMTELKCDLWPGVASGIERVASTQPYYRSTYVFVTRARDRLDGLTLDDARLRTLSIGVQMVGNDATNTPPAHAVASRGIVDNVHGYMLYGNYAVPNPAAGIMTAVTQHEVDVAMVWGPLAGYFAKQSTEPLTLTPVTPADAGGWRMVFDISMGVQMRNRELLQHVNDILIREKPAIDRILASYGVPRAD